MPVWQMFPAMALGHLGHALSVQEATASIPLTVNAIPVPNKTASTASIRRQSNPVSSARRGTASTKALRAAASLARLGARHASTMCSAQPACPAITSNPTSENSRTTVAPARLRLNVRLALLTVLYAQLASMATASWATSVWPTTIWSTL